MTRRILPLLLILAACAPRPALKVIDVHVHTDFNGKPEPASGIVISKEQLLKEMKTANVVGAVALSMGGGDDEEDLRAHNIIRCAGVGGKVTYEQIEAGLKDGRYVCLKFYLGYVHKYVADDFYKPYYELARKYKVPIVFHTGDTSTKDAKLKYSHPLQLDEFAVDNRDLTLVLAHCGNPWWRDAAEVAYKNANVYLECSGFFESDMVSLSKADIETYMIEPIRWAFGWVDDASRFLYGTDWSLVPMKPYLEAYKKAIPKEHWNKVFYENALKVFPTLKGDRPASAATAR